jgi:hypothetical protein
MGWKWYDGSRSSGPSYWEKDGEYTHSGDFHPSIDISAAWIVVEKLKENWQFSVQVDIFAKQYFVCIDCDAKTYWAEGDTAPLAICRAVLKGVK